MSLSEAAFEFSSHIIWNSVDQTFFSRGPPIEEPCCKWSSAMDERLHHSTWPYCLIWAGCCCGLFIISDPRASKSILRRPKEIEDVILFKFVLLVSVHTISVNGARVSDASNASSNNFMNNLKLSIDWYCMNRNQQDKLDQNHLLCLENTLTERETHKDWTVCMWVNNELIYMFGGTNPLKSQIEIVWNICKHLYYCSTLKQYYLRNNHLYWAFVRKAQKSIHILIVLFCFIFLHLIFCKFTIMLLADIFIQSNFQCSYYRDPNSLGAPWSKEACWRTHCWWRLRRLIQQPSAFQFTTPQKQCR